MIIEQLDKNEAIRYLGGKTVDDNMRVLLEKCEQRLLEVLTPRYAYAVYDTEFCEDGVKLCGSNVTLTGKDIKAHLDGCEKAVLLCVTAGQNADRLIRTLEAHDLAEAAMTDSLASVAAEQICDRAEQEIFTQLPAVYKTERFSPGYGDLPLSLQPALLTLCDAGRRIGLHATDSLLLTPRKSVTAIIGISDTPKERVKHTTNCDTCPARENCNIRKTGGHCGKNEDN
ncbi:MAG: methionine synthase [Eubacterium sp.]|nr:methionine synthase [Eubacterium sp.]